MDFYTKIAQIAFAESLSDCAVIRLKVPISDFQLQTSLPKPTLDY